MADFIETIQQKVRMCEAHPLCTGCPLHRRQNNHGVTCIDMISQYPQEALEIITKWSQGHIVSNEEKMHQLLKDNFDEKVADEIVSKIEADPCFLFSCIGKNGNSKKCEECIGMNFWKQEWKEPQKAEFAHTDIDENRVEASRQMGFLK